MSLTTQSVLSEFMTLASHKLRTPLTAIIWFTELLLREDVGKLNDQQKEFLRDIAIGSERMEQLIDDLLTMSRIERHQKYDIVYGTVDVVSVIREVRDKKLFGAALKKIKIVLAPKFPKHLKLEVDSDKIAHLFRVIFDNAIQFSPDKSTVTVGYKKGKGTSTFSITNKGVGIPKKDLKNVFKKFYRSEKTILSNPDTQGIGLFIAKTIIDKHKGKIWIESEEDKETTIYFTVPNKKP